MPTENDPLHQHLASQGTGDSGWNRRESKVNSGAARWGFFSGVERNAIIDRIVPQSIGAIVASLSEVHELPNGQSFDHIIVSKILSFLDYDTDIAARFPSFYAPPNHGTGNTVILSFMTGLGDDGLCNYEIVYRLNAGGEILTLKEIWSELTEDKIIGMPRYYTPNETDSWKMQDAAETTDALLDLLKRPAELFPVPRIHCLATSVNTGVIFRTKSDPQP